MIGKYRLLIFLASYCNQRQVGELGMDLVESQFKIPHLHAGCVEQRQGHFSVTEIGGNLLLLASLQIHVQNLLCTFHDVLRTMDYVLYTMDSVLRTMHFVLCICKHKILVLSTTWRDFAQSLPLRGRKLGMDLGMYRSCNCHLSSSWWYRSCWWQISRTPNIWFSECTHPPVNCNCIHWGIT